MSAFFFFPICLLAEPDANYKRTLQRVVSYCILETGRKNIKSLNDRGLVEIIDNFDTPRDFVEGEPDHRAVVVGASVLNLEIQSIEGIQRDGAESKVHIDEYQTDGPLVMVTVGTEILLDCSYGGGLSYRDFCTLCAVNSVIGRRTTPTIVRRGILIARQIGFKTMSVMKERMRKEKECRIALTVSQLRTSLDRLELRGLITRVAASPRNTYFMTGKIDRDAMRWQVVAAVPKGLNDLRSERRKDLAFIRDQDGFF